MVAAGRAVAAEQFGGGGTEELRERLKPREPRARTALLPIADRGHGDAEPVGEVGLAEPPGPAEAREPVAEPFEVGAIGCGIKGGMNHRPAIFQTSICNFYQVKAGAAFNISPISGSEYTQPGEQGVDCEREAAVLPWRGWETAMTGTDEQAKGRIGRIEDIAVHCALNDGTAVCLRTITPDDAPLIRDGIAKLSAESRYLRFFSPAPVLPDAVVARLADVDGHDHIAWGAICSDCPGQPPIGAVHAVRHPQGGPVGEFSIAVLDEFQGQGLARMMTAALLVQCRAEGLDMLDVHMLSENAAARRLVKSLGAAWAGESAGVADYRLDVAAGIEALRADGDAPGVRAVLRTLESAGGDAGKRAD